MCYCSTSRGTEESPLYDISLLGDLVITYSTNLVSIVLRAFRTFHDQCTVHIRILTMFTGIFRVKGSGRRLRVVPYFSSGIAERATLFSSVGWFSRALAFRSLYSGLRKNGGLLVVYSRRFRAVIFCFLTGVFSVVVAVFGVFSFTAILRRHYLLLQIFNIRWTLLIITLVLGSIFFISVAFFLFY